MLPTTIHTRLDDLSSLNPGLHNRDFLLTWEHPESTIRFVLAAAALLEELARARVSARVFDTGLGVSIFRDKSTRTRHAFRAGCNLLGLATEELEESTSQVSHGETARETATMIGFLTEAIGIRDDMFLGEGHRYMQEVAASLEESYREGVLAQRPAVLNLQCDLDHPTQSLADLMHLIQVFGGLEALGGKRLVMSWAYSPTYGKPLSVPQGVIALMTRFGMDVVLARPEGYDLVNEPLDAARHSAEASGGSFRIVGSMAEAFDAADIVYPKSWAPLWAMRERTSLQRAGDAATLGALEGEALANNARFKDWACDEAMMRRTRDGRALYMHCLPADVSGVSCPQGEVSRAVFERARLDTYREARHKPFIVAALILATRFADPARALSDIVERATGQGRETMPRD
ncbi:MAG: knotted carbamoyltransferase YgeW [Acidobacteria bacterium]|nr:knotted carbamoyltransferase YgeW [Acidobacteriota bacterium]